MYDSEEDYKDLCEMILTDFISSITHEEWQRIRGSLSDAEARRILKEKA